MPVPGGETRSPAGEGLPSFGRRSEPATAMKLELHQLEQKYASLRAREPAREQRLLASLGEQLLALRRLGPGQGHQHPLGRLRRKPALLDSLLDRRRQYPHQIQPPTHPALRPIESRRQLLLPKAVLVPQRPQHPPLLERRPRPRVVEAEAPQERLRLRHLHHPRVRPVARQSLQRPHPRVAVDQHPPTRLLRRRHPHRRLLPVESCRPSTSTYGGWTCWAWIGRPCPARRG
jgi:hypothetical protein